MCLKHWLLPLLVVCYSIQSEGFISGIAKLCKNVLITLAPCSCLSCVTASNQKALFQEFQNYAKMCLKHWLLAIASHMLQHPIRRLYFRIAQMHFAKMCLQHWLIAVASRALQHPIRRLYFRIAQMQNAKCFYNIASLSLPWHYLQKPPKDLTDKIPQSISTNLA